MNIITFFIEGVCLIDLNVFEDERGYFFEAYNQKSFAKAGLNMNFVQDNQSVSKYGVLRGLHFQKKHPQGKLIQVLDGEIFDVAVDIRRGSKTFGKHLSFTLSGEQKKILYIPEGFAHGFLVLSKTACVMYKCTDFYYPEYEGGIRWDDPSLDIKWPAKNAIVSEKDAKLPLFNELQLIG